MNVSLSRETGLIQATKDGKTLELVVEDVQDILASFVNTDLRPGLKKSNRYEAVVGGVDVVDKVGGQGTVTITRQDIHKLAEFVRRNKKSISVRGDWK